MIVVNSDCGIHIPCILSTLVLVKLIDLLHFRKFKEKPIKLLLMILLESILLLLVFFNNLRALRMKGWVITGSDYEAQVYDLVTHVEQSFDTKCSMPSI